MTHCTVCGASESVRWASFQLHDETDGSMQHLDGAVCIVCYDAILETVEARA